MPPGPSSQIPASDSLDTARWYSEEVHPHAAQLKAYLRGSFPSVGDVDDVVQESFLQMLKVRAVQPIQSSKAFLFTVARHIALNLVRRERGAPIFSVGELADVRALEDRPDAHECLSREEKRQLLVEALASLPPRCREITVLRKLRGVPQKEAAAMLGLSEKTIEEQVARGVRRCASYLRKRGIRSADDI